MKQALFIGAIASVLTLNNAMATGENTVTSKSYVDARDATKQDIISMPGAEGFIMIYDGIDEETGQSMFDARDVYPDVSLDQWDGTDKPTGLMIPDVHSVWLALQDRQAKMTCAGWPDGTTQYDTTHTDANCWLWNKN